MNPTADRLIMLPTSTPTTVWAEPHSPPGWEPALPSYQWKPSHNIGAKSNRLERTVCEHSENFGKERENIKIKNQSELKNTVN